MFEKTMEQMRAALRVPSNMPKRRFALVGVVRKRTNATSLSKVLRGDGYWLDRDPNHRPTEPSDHPSDRSRKKATDRPSDQPSI